MSESRRFREDHIEALLQGDSAVGSWANALRSASNVEMDAALASSHIMAAASAVVPTAPVGMSATSASRTKNPRRRRVFTALFSSFMGKVLAGGVALATVTGGVAATGALPDAIQDPLADVYGVVGFDFPSSDDDDLEIYEIEDEDLNDVEDVDVDDVDESEVEDVEGVEADDDPDDDQGEDEDGTEIFDDAEDDDADDDDADEEVDADDEDAAGDDQGEDEDDDESDDEDSDADESDDQGDDDNGNGDNDGGDDDSDNGDDSGDNGGNDDDDDDSGDQGDDGN